MRVSLEWLHEYVGVTLPPDQLARLLTLSTAEVEAIERSHSWNQVTVGSVVHAEPMPGSDHLRLVDVETGRGVQRVVCGAPNVAQGQKIAYAAIGARLLDPRGGGERVLKAAKIRGYESHGMVCSEAELGLSGNHEGILELPLDSPIGAPLGDVLGDTVFVIGGWAHRADLQSMLGIAREVAALTDQLVVPPSTAVQATGGDVAARLSIEIQDSDLCSRYVGAVVDGVKIGPSPEWMQQRLRAAGQRPINNVVDITNYVMLELGQPLHAFDYDRIRDHRIIVRRAVPGERLTTLDGVDRALQPDTLVIADPAGPVALAGVMGGAATEVGETTSTILLEAATFSGVSIRRTSTRLALRSEASSRFEKQLPAGLAAVAAARATQLLVDLAGGTPCHGFIDVYPVPQQEIKIALRAARLQRILGIEVSSAEVLRSLRALGFGCEWRAPDRYEVAVPYWRMDVSIQDDVIEEVIRILGFERLPSTTISGRVPDYQPQPLRELRDRAKDALVAAGAQEVITYSAVSEALLRRVTPPEDLAILQPLRIVNPMSAEHEVMRTTLRGSMLETLAENLKLRRPSLSFFETAAVFLPHADRTSLPEEREMLIGAITGERTDRWGSGSGERLDFFDAKGIVEALATRLGLEVELREGSDSLLIEGMTAVIRSKGERLGVLGAVHPDVLAGFDIRGDVFLYEMDLTALLPLVGGVRRFDGISRFPAVQEDLALVVDEQVASGDLITAIKRSRLVRAVRPFDEYRGDPIPAGKRSLAFALTYQAADRTLTDEDVVRARRGILEGLRRQYGAELRG